MARSGRKSINGLPVHATIFFDLHTRAFAASPNIPSISSQLAHLPAKSGSFGSRLLAIPASRAKPHIEIRKLAKRMRPILPVQNLLQQIASSPGFGQDEPGYLSAKIGPGRGQIPGFPGMTTCVEYVIFCDFALFWRINGNFFEIQ